MRRIKFSNQFNEDWNFYVDNKDKFTFAGEHVKWEPSKSGGSLSAKECFWLFDSTGKRHPCSEQELLLSVLVCKKSINFHIKMWVEGYEDCGQGVDVYLKEFKNPPDWIAKAFRKQLYAKFKSKSFK